VVGAGLSGLAAIKQLADRSIPFDCFEIGENIGGNWRYNNTNGRSPAYASLHIDTSKDRFAFGDLPMPEDWPAYLHHSQVLEYLETYADEFGLRQMVTYRHRVVSITQGDDGWQVVAVNVESGESVTNLYGAVVVANGHHWDPNLPEEVDVFDGESIHASEYRIPDPYIGKDVLVVGVGNTGVDIASEVSWHAKSVTLSTRSGAHVLPRYVFGRPLDTLSNRRSSQLPLAVQRSLYKALLLAVRGRQSSYGFPEPEGPLLSQHPTVSQEVLRLVKDGHIEMRRGISRMTSTGVIFADGDTEDFDAIIYATGYRISFPFLDDVSVVSSDNRIDLYKRIVPVDYPGLYFVGLIQPVGALPPLVEQQARWVAQRIDGAPLPTDGTMRAEIARDREQVELQYQDRPRHTIQVDYWPYLDMMRNLCDEYDLAPNESAESV
ncbi:MAG: NAD(P)-binding domain-containing protein, partial [Acidimicrobiia bacterium]